MTQPDAIYGFVAERGAPCRLPALWARFKAHEAFVNPDQDAEALFAGLASQFSRDDLLHAGVVRANDQGQLELEPTLSEQGRMLAALRKTSKGSPFCLLSGRGCLGGHHWPFSAILEDFRTRTLQKQAGDQLLIASSMKDVAIFWSMGLPAAPAIGLDRFSRQQIDVFCKSLGASRYNDSTYSFASGMAKKAPVSLVLVGWSPSQLDVQEPARIKSVQSHLRNLHVNLGIDLHDVLVWKPSEANIERLRFCLDVGSSRDVKRALLESLETASAPLIETPVTSKLQPAYADLLRDWIAMQQNRHVDRTARQRAWDELQEQLERQIIDPLARQALKFDDPRDRELGLALADISRLRHTQSLRMATDYSNSMRNLGGKSTVLLPPDELKQQLAMANCIRSLRQELQPCRCKRKRNTARSSSRAPATSRSFDPRTANSASAQASPKADGASAFSINGDDPKDPTKNKTA